MRNFLVCATYVRAQVEKSDFASSGAIKDMMEQLISRLGRRRELCVDLW
jgi:hypothetical protein